MSVAYCWLCGGELSVNMARMARPIYDRKNGREIGIMFLHIPCGDKLNYFLIGYKKHAVLQYIKILNELK